MLRLNRPLAGIRQLVTVPQIAGNHRLDLVPNELALPDEMNVPD